MSGPVNRCFAGRDRHESLPWSVANNGRFRQFEHPDLTWLHRGARMPGNLRDPDQDTELFALPLPSLGPAEGSISDFFEPKSGWAETAHFQLQTIRRHWQGHASDSEESWDNPSVEQGEPVSVGPGAHGAQEHACGWLGRYSLGSVLGSFSAGAGGVFEPPYLRATEEVVPGVAIWFGTECLLP